jgi:hypothetical protein
VRLTQLQWIEVNTHGDADGAAAGGGTDGLDETAIAGVHGLERHDGSWFRWSEPVVSFQVAERATGGEFRIETGGLRGSAAGFVTAAYLGKSRLPRSSLRPDGSALAIDLPAGPAGILTLLCRPLTGSGEDRRLGAPLFSAGLS